MKDQSASIRRPAASILSLTAGVLLILALVLAGVLTISHAESTLPGAAAEARKERRVYRKSSTEGGSNENWPVFRDDDYGVQVRYPTHWTFREAQVADLGEDFPIRRVVEFGPSVGADVVMPIALEIGTGELEWLGEMWPILDEEGHVKSVDTYVNGYAVRTGQGMYGETFYVFEHPVHNELQVAVRVNADSGDTDRIIQQMLVAFTFFHVHPLI